MSESAGYGRLSQDDWEAVEASGRGWIDLAQYPPTDPDQALRPEELTALRTAFTDDSVVEVDEASWQSMLDGTVSQPQSLGTGAGTDEAHTDELGAPIDGDAWPASGGDDDWMRGEDDLGIADDPWTGDADPEDTPWS